MSFLLWKLQVQGGLNRQVVFKAGFTVWLSNDIQSFLQKFEFEIN